MVVLPSARTRRWEVILRGMAGLESPEAYRKEAKERHFFDGFEAELEFEDFRDKDWRKE